MALQSIIVSEVFVEMRMNLHQQDIVSWTMFMSHKAVWITVKILPSCIMIVAQYLSQVRMCLMKSFEPGSPSTMGGIDADLELGLELMDRTDKHRPLEMK